MKNLVNCRVAWIELYVLYAARALAQGLQTYLPVSPSFTLHTVTNRPFENQLLIWVRIHSSLEISAGSPLPTGSRAQSSAWTSGSSTITPPNTPPEGHTPGALHSSFTAGQAFPGTTLIPLPGRLSPTPSSAWRPPASSFKTQLQGDTPSRWPPLTFSSRGSHTPW